MSVELGVPERNTQSSLSSTASTRPPCKTGEYQPVVGDARYLQAEGSSARTTVRSALPVVQITGLTQSESGLKDADHLPPAE